MRAYSLTQLGDRELLTALKSLVVQDRATTAALIAHLAEADYRRLYLPAGYPSMREYCVRELGMSEDAAYKRIQVIRTARECPALLVALADGRLHLCGAVLLAAHLTPANADELIAAATHKTKAEIERMIAERFPRGDVPARVQSLLAPPPEQADQLAPGQVGINGSVVADQPAAAPFPRVKPLSTQRFAVQFTIDQGTHDDLECVRGLLGHQIPSGDIAQVFSRALRLLRKELERKKFGAIDRPRADSRRKATGKRTVPAHVKREVWARDRGRCTFVGSSGKRCPATTRLEFDHVVPVARGGRATVEGIRLLCRAHNQYEAEGTFGDGFMHEKREAAKARAAAAEVIPWLRSLGLRADESRRAAALTEAIADAPLEQRVRLALTCFGPRGQSHTPAIRQGFAGPVFPRIA